MASRVASTSRSALRSIARPRQFTQDLRLRAPAQELIPPPPPPASGPSWLGGPGNSQSGRRASGSKRKGKQRDDDFLEDPPETTRPGQHGEPASAETRGVPVVASPETARGETGQEEQQQQQQQQTESDEGALPVQQIMSSDMDPHKIPGGSRSATEVLMSIEPYLHPHHQHGQHHDGSHHHGGDASSSGGRRAAGPLPGVPLPHPHAAMDSLPLRHPFNTAHFVAALESSDFDRAVSEAFMRATKQMLISEQERSLSNLVGKQDLENQAYLFKAALDELQTEVQVQCRNDGIALRSANGQLQREIDAFSQKLREDIHDIKNDIQIDFNSRKEESTAEQKNLELKIIDLGNKFTVSLGEVRTELEAKKWLQTRRALAMIGTLVALVVFTTSLEGAGTPLPPPIPHVPTADELGIRPSYTESASGGPWLEKRVGEEDE